MLMIITTFKNCRNSLLWGKSSRYLEVTGLHPWNESVNETTDILAFDAVGVILQVVDDVGSNCDLLLGVGGGQVRVKLVQSSHDGVMMLVLGGGEISINCSSFY